MALVMPLPARRPRMSIEHCDLAIIGAGPAGMSAAVVAARLGARVVVLDEQRGTGGQIYRAINEAPAHRVELLGPDYAAGRALAQAFAASGARHLTNAAVWQVTPEGAVHYLRDGATATL